MARKYGKKASEKVGRTLHEFKRGKLKSGSGKKVTSRKQAIAIGLAQARRAGGKVPPAPRGHATMRLDARVRAYLSNMQPGTEIDGWGMARALKIEPIAASHALERAQKDGLAVTSDGRWFGAARGINHRSGAMIAKKTKARLDREIDQTVGKRIDRKKLGEMMSPWGGDFAYGEGTGAIGAVSSYYYSGKKYPDRVWVERALKAIEANVPRAEHGAHGWTKSDAKDLRRIAQGLRYYLLHDYKE